MFQTVYLCGENQTVMKSFILADNQELTNFALQSLLKRGEGNEVYQARNKAALYRLLEKHENSVVLLDYTLFDFEDATQLLIASERFAMTQWVLISEELTRDFLSKVVYSSDAFSVVFKDEPLQAVRETVSSASAGKRFVSQRAVEELLRQPAQQQKPSLLTETEMEILRAIAMGMTTKEIAGERFSSIHTINTHRKNIFRKLSVNTAHEALKYALRAGWVNPDEIL